MPDKRKSKTCICGCGKVLDMIGAGSRKYWYDHEKIGKDRFWFYMNHPPNCACGCGQETDWDEINLMWREFKAGHERIHLRKNHSPHRKQIDLFPNATKGKKVKAKNKIENIKL
jgi:hypothetical protein